MDLTQEPIPTGRTLVLFKDDANIKEIMEAVDLATGTTSDGPASGDIEIIEALRVGVVDAGSASLSALDSAECVAQTRPEYFMFSDVDPKARQQWAREGLVLLIEQWLADAEDHREPAPAPEPPPEMEASAVFKDTATLTWGLQAVGADKTTWTGKGIKVAVLDTGIATDHPDFAGRKIVNKIFTRERVAGDKHGHGTHCSGTVAGPVKADKGRRYGVAPDVDLYFGKVLYDMGYGHEFDILRGIEWMIKEGVQVISMSIGRAVQVNEKPDPLYEKVGKVALDAGCLIVAAAGNESSRNFGRIAPVGAPANSPSIMAVGAVDRALKCAGFSCGGVNKGGGEVDVAAPGVDVYSSSPSPRMNRLASGTSMACPHVAGIAALWAASDETLRGRTLWKAITDSSKAIGVARDYGYGLVQAPAGEGNGTDNYRR